MRYAVIRQITLALWTVFALLQTLCFAEKSFEFPSAEVATQTHIENFPEKDLSAWPDVPRFDFTMESITNIGSEAIKICNDKLNILVRIPAKERTFENTVQAFENAIATLGDTLQIPQFMGRNSKDRAVRKAASRIVIFTSRYLVDVFTRRDLYIAVKEVAEAKPVLKDEDQIMLGRMLTNFKRNGLELSDEKLGECRILKKRLDDCKIIFVSRILSCTDRIEVSRDVLSWLSDDELSGFEKTEDGRYIVDDCDLLLDKAKDEKARKDAEYLLNRRCTESNLPLLDEMLQIRQKIASLLGYANFAAYAIEDKMAKNPKAVLIFLDKLIEKFQPMRKEKLTNLVNLKAEETGMPISILNSWDLDYYSNKELQAKQNLDQKKLSEFFPLNPFLKNMLAFFEPIFGVTFVKTTLPTWCEDVVSYVVRDEKNDILGYLYLDLLSRQNNAGFIRCENLVTTRILSDGTRRKPSAVIQAGLHSTIIGNHALLSLSDVEGILHEFGHALHLIFSRAKYSTMTGTHSTYDFAEVPSTFMENFAGNPEALKKFSSHFQTSEPLSDELIAKAINERSRGLCLFMLRQLMLSKYDLLLHSGEVKDSTLLFEKLQQEILMIPMTKDTTPQTFFAHLANDYESGYYTYLWDEAISSDLFSKFQKHGISSSLMGKRFRDIVLAPGRVIDATSLTTKFLGRKYNDNALMEKYGLDK
ncbi:MAG: Zn-dependent oligopeptidase [Candidatus Riflebacteria bacterium]|nr:Zn-dependent oligopeptidase [Candidatus Riflebacteria bacterium]